MVYVFCLVVLLAVWTGYTLNYQNRSKRYNNINGRDYKPSYNRVPNYCVNIVFLYLFLVVALRGVSVGWDTWQYQRSYNLIGNIRSLTDLIEYRVSGYTTMEWGFIAFEWICSRFLPFQVFLGLCAAVYLVPVSIYINKYSENKLFSTFLFITFGLYTFCFSTVRQAMAMGITIIAMMCLHDGKRIKSFIVLLIAFAFHRTALTMLPALVYDKVKLNRKTIIAIVLAAAVVYWQRTAVLGYLLGYARSQGKEIETGGTFLYLFIVGIVILGAYNWKSLKEKRINVFLFISQCFILVIIPVLRVNPTYFRIYYFNFLFMPVYVTNMLNCLENKSVKMMVKLGIIIVGFYYFYKSIMLTNNPLLPYSFFWQNN